MNSNWRDTISEYSIEITITIICVVTLLLMTISFMFFHCDDNCKLERRNEALTVCLEEWRYTEARCDSLMQGLFDNE